MLLQTSRRRNTSRGIVTELELSPSCTAIEIRLMESVLETVREQREYGSAGGSSSSRRGACHRSEVGVGAQEPQRERAGAIAVAGSCSRNGSGRAGAAAAAAAAAASVRSHRDFYIIGQSSLFYVNSAMKQFRDPRRCNAANHHIVAALSLLRSGAHVSDHAMPKRK